VSPKTGDGRNYDGLVTGSRSRLDSDMPATRSLDDSERSRWFNSASPVKAVALVLHGLNMLPSRMTPLSTWLASRGVDAYRATLRGHDGDMPAFKAATRQDYLDDTLTAYDIAATRARAAGVPLHLLAFSFGALVAFDLLHTHVPTRFDRAVLFAPALAPRPSTRLVRALSMFPRLVLRSASRRDFRVFDGSPIAAFNALFAAVGALERARYARADLPTLVFVDPKDVLVSLAAIERLARDFAISAWRVVPVTTDRGRLTRTFHHLITEPDAVGDDLWREMTSMAAAHLGL
jgi:pimeloyl-ACP methyl ester carboxylesterase